MSSKKKDSASSSKDLDNSYQLSNNRYITVSEFKEKIRVDIREYYLNDDGERKPGKKGISLSLQEWNKLKELIPKIDSAAKNQTDDDSVSDTSSSSKD